MPKKPNHQILVSITGSTNHDWQAKLAEIQKRKIREIALFMECFQPKNKRWNIYRALQKSCVEKIPLVHIRNDMAKDELLFLQKNFKTRYFTIHEDSFKIMKKWQGFYKNLFLEFNTDNYLAQNVKIEKIGGFCLDLSHFKASEEKWSREFEYVLKNRKNKNIFACNHLNGYDYKKNCDLHTVTSLKQFRYLKTLPKFVFGKVMALEISNSISDQLTLKRHLLNSLKKIFNK
jgi:hypothetical protein